MILGSIYYINKDFKDWNTKTIIALLIGAAIGISISFLDPAKENDNLKRLLLINHEFTHDIGQRIEKLEEEDRKKELDKFRKAKLKEEAD